MCLFVFFFLGVSVFFLFFITTLFSKTNFLMSSFLKQHPCSYWLPLICIAPQDEQSTIYIIPGSPVVPLVSSCI